MSRSNVFLLAVALVAIGLAFYYRQQQAVPAKPIPDTPKLAFVTGGSGPYWQLTADGARAAAKSLKCDLEVSLPAEEESLNQQMAILTALQVDSLDGVAVSPLDAEGQTSLINRMQQKTNVVTFDSDAPHSLRRSHVGTSNYAAGILCARLVAEALPEGGKVAVLMANLTKENMIDRKSGFEETLSKAEDSEEREGKAPELSVTNFMIDNGDLSVTKNNIEIALNDHDDLACIVGMNSKHGAVILKTLEELDKLGEIKVVAFDAEPATLEGVEQGHIYATIAQDPYKYGYEATRILATLSRSGDYEVPIVGGGTININAEAVRKEELEKFKDRLIARTAKAEKGKEAAK